MTISEKVAYLKGLAEGLDLDTEKSKEGKLISKIIDILEDIGLAVEDLEEEVEAIDEELEAISEDLADVEDMIFEDYDDDDDDDDDEDDDEEFDFADLGDDFFEIDEVFISVRSSDEDFEPNPKLLFFFFNVISASTESLSSELLR